MVTTARALQNNPKQTTSVNAFVKTIINRLHEGGLRVRQPLADPLLTSLHSGASIAVAIEPQNWQVCHWRPVHLTEESRLSTHWQT